MPAHAYTPREFARLPPGKSLLYGALLGLVEITGSWKYPIRAHGDYEEMTTRDVLYWLHKAKHHVTRPPRGSGLQEYFEKQPLVHQRLQDKFTVDSDVSISAAGDLMDHEYLTKSWGLYDHIADEIFGADVSMANLECVVLDKPSGAARFDGKTAPL